MCSLSCLPGDLEDTIAWKVHRAESSGRPGIGAGLGASHRPGTTVTREVPCESLRRLVRHIRLPQGWDSGELTPAEGWLHIVSDLGVWSACLAISGIIGFFLLRKKEVPFRGVFWLFGALIFACGATHLMEAVIFWWPAYRLAGLIKLVTAVISWAAVIALVPMVPRALAMRGPEELMREIDVRKRVEEELRLAQDRLELAIRSSNVGIWELEIPDGGVEHSLANCINLWEMLGYDGPEMPTTSAERMEFVHPDDRKRLLRLIESNLCGETTEIRSEHRVRHRDGSYRWVLARGSTVRDARGRPRRQAGIMVDIHDLKCAEEALRASERRFRTFVDHATDAFFLFSEHRVLDVNGPACESLGYTRDELVGMTSSDVDHDLTPASLEDQVRKVEAGEMVSFGTRFRRKDGTVFPVEVRGHLFWDGGRQFEVVMVRDITERKRAEEALRESEERFRGTFENAAVGIAHKDLTGRFLRVNEKLCTIVGYTREELLATSSRNITDPADLAVSIEAFDRLMRGESPSFSLEKRYLRKDRTPVWVEVTASLQHDEVGAPVLRHHGGPGHLGTEDASRKNCTGRRRGSSSRYAARTSGSGTSTCRTATSRTTLFTPAITL